MRSSPPRSALLLLLLLLAIAAVGCRSAGGESAESESEGAADDDDSGEEEPATSVRVSTLKTGPIARTIASSATIEAARRADIHLEVAGTIESVLHEEGDLVAAGEVLALLRNPALAGELERAEASHERARQDFASVESLYGQGFVSRNEYEASSHALQTARVTLDQARESHRARQIRSPIVGTLSTRAVRFGEAVSPGALAFQASEAPLPVRLPALRPRGLPAPPCSR